MRAPASAGQDAGSASLLGVACFGLNLLGIAVWLSVQKLLLLRGVPYLPLIVLTYAIGAAAVAVTAAAASLRRPAVWPLSTMGA